MNRVRGSSIVAAATLLSCSGMALAQTQAISDADDLTAVIALDGKPCGKVVHATKQDEDDHVAACEDGNRYRVYIKDGRVVVDKAN